MGCESGNADGMLPGVSPGTIGLLSTATATSVGVLSGCGEKTYRSLDGGRTPQTGQTSEEELWEVLGNPEEKAHSVIGSSRGPCEVRRTGVPGDPGERYPR